MVKWSKLYHRYNKHRSYKKALIFSAVVIVGLIGFIFYQNQSSIESSNPEKVINTVEKNAGSISSSSEAILNQFSQESSSVINNADQTSNPPSSNLDIISIETQVNELINQQRIANGLGQLNYDYKLSDIARSHSQEMVNLNYFSHNSADGTILPQRYIKYGYQCNGWSGENIADLGFDDPKLLASQVVNDWMNSQEHRMNILNPNYHNEGIGIALKGNEAYITEDFC